MSDTTPRTPAEDIAIIGMSGRFPGARDLDMFWRNLRDGVESITFFPNEDLEATAISPPDPHVPRYIKA